MEGGKGTATHRHKQVCTEKQFVWARLFAGNVHVVTDKVKPINLWLREYFIISKRSNVPVGMMQQQ